MDLLLKLFCIDGVIALVMIGLITTLDVDKIPKSLAVAILLTLIVSFVMLPILGIALILTS